MKNSNNYKKLIKGWKMDHHRRSWERNKRLLKHSMSKTYTTCTSRALKKSHNSLLRNRKSSLIIGERSNLLDMTNISMMSFLRIDIKKLSKEAVLSTIKTLPQRTRIHLHLQVTLISMVHKVQLRHHLDHREIRHKNSLNRVIHISRYQERTNSSWAHRTGIACWFSTTKSYKCKNILI